MTATTTPTTGIPDPAKPECWLVTPWPNKPSFSDVVRHFVRAYYHQLQGETNTVRMLAYFEGWAAAMATASTDYLRDAGARHWHDDLVGAVADCVHIFRERREVELQQARRNVRELPSGVQIPIFRSVRRGRAS